MAEHTLQTNPPEKGIVFKLRYDTYTHWMNSDLILKAGEAAIATFPNDNPLLPPKAVGIKIGDGRGYFDELPWIQAIASDVFNWAKSSTPPSADMIPGLNQYIQEHAPSSGGGSGGSGQYRIIYDSTTNQYILQQYNETTQEWDNTSSSINLNDIISRINTIERWANGARTQLGNIEAPLVAYVYDELVEYMNKLDVYDEPIEGQFVTAVLQNDGKILIQRAPIDLSQISQGTLGTEHGGTGLTQVFEDEVLIGSLNGTITTTSLTTEIENNRNAIATVGAIKDYVTEKTAGLTGAMHFIGESPITITPGSNFDPQIPRYNFRNAQAGDVILANNAQEFVWTGSEWRLLGDEGSYAIKGSITNVDIAEEANIAQSKINGLEDDLNNKVDIIEGKGLSSNDYTDEEKEKLEDIEYVAQANVIEHVFLNDDEILPTTVNGFDKSIDLQFNGMSQEQGEKLEGIESGAQVNVIEQIQLNNNPLPINNKTVNIELVEYTTEEKEKLATIQEGAQVNTINSIIMDGTEQTSDQGVVSLVSNPEHANKIEHIFINGTEKTPETINGEAKSVNIIIDESALTFQILKGARYPSGANAYTDIDIDQNSKKLELSHLAATGDIQHLLQTQDTYVILNCGSSTDVI